MCDCVPISHLLTVGYRSTLIQHSVLNVKVPVGAFNQEKALVRVLSMTVKLHEGSFQALMETVAMDMDEV